MKNSSHLVGPAPHFRPTAASGLAPPLRPRSLPRAPHSCALRVTRPRSDRARTREPCGGHAPASSPHGTIDLPRSDRPRPAFKSPCPSLPLHSRSLSLSFSFSKSRAGARARRRAPPASSSLTATPFPDSRCQLLRLHLAHPVLASVSHGKLSFLGNPSPE